MRLLSWIRFESWAEKVMFFVVVGGAAVFVVYLLGDTMYHKFKWYRLQRKAREAGRDEEGN